ERAADLVQCGDQPGDVLAAGEPAEQHAQDETGEYLGPEGRPEGQREGFRVRGHGPAPLRGRVRTVTWWSCGALAMRGAARSSPGGSGTTARGGDPAEIHVQARHERNTPGRGEHGC